MLLFTNMVAQTAVLYHCKIIESVSWPAENYTTIMMDLVTRSLAAAQEIVKLTKALGQLNYFKVSHLHPVSAYD